VVSLAQAAYDERDLPSGHLDPGRLAVLADALEDAGGSDPDILGHLRGPGPHTRGCWVLDALLRKGQDRGRGDLAGCDGAAADPHKGVTSSPP
jgi:hypothetical protein